MHFCLYLLRARCVEGCTLNPAKAPSLSHRGTSAQLTSFRARTHVIPAKNPVIPSAPPSFPQNPRHSRASGNPTNATSIQRATGTGTPPSPPLFAPAKGGTRPAKRDAGGSYTRNTIAAAHLNLAKPPSFPRRREPSGRIIHPDEPGATETPPSPPLFASAKGGRGQRSETQGVHTLAPP